MRSTLISLDDQATRAELMDAVRAVDRLCDELLGNAADAFYATEQDRQDYDAHMTVFEAGQHFRERAAFGGNRVGKSTAGAYETALHLTGRYPGWWKGARFTRPIRAWCASETSAVVRDVAQVKLLGEHSAPGTGMLPKDSIVETRPSRGIPDAIDTIQVRHKTGGVSTLAFKSYQSGRETFQGERVDFIWLDEEPSQSIYEECLLRTASTSKTQPRGLILCTMTPLKGLSEVAAHFMTEGRLAQDQDRFGILIGWDDIPHITAEEKADLLKSIPLHQRDARTRGIPSIGIGAIYQYSEKSIVIEPFDIPRYYRMVIGLDVGWQFTAACVLAVNPDTDEHFLVADYKGGRVSAAEHVARIKLMHFHTSNLNTVIDPASRGSSQRDGQKLFDDYRELGLRVFLAENAVEGGLHHIQNLIETNRFRVFSSCKATLAEMRLYARTDLGKVKKVNDHCMDAMRYAIMTPKYHRQPKPLRTPRVLKSMP